MRKIWYGKNKEYEKSQVVENKYDFRSREVGTAKYINLYKPLYRRGEAGVMRLIPFRLKCYIIFSSSRSSIPLPPLTPRIYFVTLPEADLFPDRINLSSTFHHKSIPTRKGKNCWGKPNKICSQYRVGGTGKTAVGLIFYRENDAGLYWIVFIQTLRRLVSRIRICNITKLILITLPRTEYNWKIFPTGGKGMAACYKRLSFRMVWLYPT